ncbi:MAG: response regulator, partial [Desulfuromonadaceae bacterium]
QELLQATDPQRPGMEKSRYRELILNLQAISRARMGKRTDSKRSPVRKPVEKSPPPAATTADRNAGGNTLSPEPEQADKQPEEQLPTLATAMLGSSESIRVATGKLSSLLLQAEEMLGAKLAVQQRSLNLRETQDSLEQWQKEWSKYQPLLLELKTLLKKPSAGNGTTGGKNPLKPALRGLVEFLEWNRSFMKSLEENFAAQRKAIVKDGRIIGSMVDNLLDNMKHVLMFPFSELLELLPKLVRDLARDSGKRVELQFQGGEVEIDRRIMEAMKDPLMHLVRNCIDHGIEAPPERKRKNKPETGLIQVSVTPKDNRVELVVADDGAGISLTGVRSTLLKLSGGSRETLDRLSDAELLHTVFQSGLSTSPIITQLSGRGLGLAIVKEKVEQLGGHVSLDSQPDRGTRFQLLLPLTLATFRGILVRLKDRQFVLPSTHVERVLRLKRAEIKTVENRETIRHKDELLSLVGLSDVLELPLRPEPSLASDLLQILILQAGGLRIAFVVDSVEAEQEVLFKNLGPQLVRVTHIAGATVLGNGRVVPILNVPDLMKSAIRNASSASRWTAVTADQTAPRKPSVLIAEDSITTRTLLKNVLESSGYHVVTAVDGMDAFSKLKTERFDILVSDVDMPRLNGFDLTNRVRNEKGLEDLPIVLVTALASREDRERGIDAGANAYIPKGTFDQANLLDVMKRLT